MGAPRVLAELPLADDVPVPFGSVRTGRRTINWRSDRPHTLYLVEALDGGDAGAEATHRDLVSTWEAPFEGEPTPLWKTELRYGGISWGDGELAMGEEWWYDTRQVRTWMLQPDAPEAAPKLVFDRSYQDAYADPGSPVFTVGPWGRGVLQQTRDGALLLSGKGAKRPNIDALTSYSKSWRNEWMKKSTNARCGRWRSSTASAASPNTASDVPSKAAKVSIVATKLLWLPKLWLLLQKPPRWKAGVGAIACDKCWQGGLRGRAEC